MIQTKLVSLIETATQTITGYLLSILVQVAVFPLFGIQVSLSTNLLLGLIFLITSFIRGYLIRRLFNSFQPLLKRD